MLEAIKETFRQRMREDKTIFLYGEDIEDPKGDVFGLTRGLTEEFPDQVKNSPLAEATIVGVSVGRALAGGNPSHFYNSPTSFPSLLIKSSPSSDPCIGAPMAHGNALSS